jgi:Holliday junction resolvase RusA-like endonuclease
MRNLQADLELCKRATPGPWEVDDTNRELVAQLKDGVYEYICDCDAINYAITNLSVDEVATNAQFIAAARTGWPEAIERAIAAEARVAELERQLTIERAEREQIEAVNSELEEAIHKQAAAAEAKLQHVAGAGNMDDITATLEAEGLARRKAARVISLTVPGEPVGKARARVTKFGTFTPTKTVNYETLVRELFAIHYPHWQPETEPLRMDLRAYYTIPKSASKKRMRDMAANKVRPMKKPDADNLVKIIADACNGLAYHDDAQIVEVSCSKWYSPVPRVEIKIERLDGVCEVPESVRKAVE